jgi:hypothetical protein
MADYIVVGGEYADTSFTNPAPGVVLERHGPYSEAEAKRIWRSLTARSVDNAMVRYFLRPAAEDHGKNYWVVGGEYANSRFDQLAPKRQLEVYGPFENDEALGFWRGLTAKSVDDALVRYEIRKNFTPEKADVAQHLPTPHVRTKTKSVAIAAPPEKVFKFLADPTNWPKWAIHHVTAAESSRDRVSKIDTPQGGGRLILKFEERTGILDYELIDHNGRLWRVPGRLIPAGAGTVVIMTYLKAPDISESAFASGLAHVDDELATLRAILEGR